MEKTPLIAVGISSSALDILLLLVGRLELVADGAEDEAAITERWPPEDR